MVADIVHQGADAHQIRIIFLFRVGCLLLAEDVLGVLDYALQSELVMVSQGLQGERDLDVSHIVRTVILVHDLGHRPGDLFEGICHCAHD